MQNLTISKSIFNASHTFECGQSFRFEPIDGGYRGVVDKSVIELIERETDYEVKVVLGQISREKLSNYFDLETDYESISRLLAEKDEHLKKAIAVSKGLRILNQSPFETLVTFIISSNNNIPKIKMSVEALCEKYGDLLGRIDDTFYYAFPSVDKLAGASLEDLRVKAIGYRNKALYHTVQLILDESIDLSAPYMMSYEACKTFLKQFYGVGDKVADCIALFAYGKREAFPVDTWVKKMLTTLYGIDKNYQIFANTYFDQWGGYAQQYLFYYMRSFYGKE